MFSLLRPFRGHEPCSWRLRRGRGNRRGSSHAPEGVGGSRARARNPPPGSSEQLLFLLLAIVAGLLLVRLASAGVTTWKAIVGSRVGTAMTAGLRQELVEKLNALPLSFYDRNQVGALMSQVAYDTETLHTLVYQMTGGSCCKPSNWSGSA